MKVTCEKDNASFRPFTLNIVVESEKEAEALYAIFLPRGYITICEAIRACVGRQPDYHHELNAIRKDVGAK